MGKQVPEEDQLIQYSCRRCLGEAWLRIPFTPKFCSHCGVQLEYSGVKIARAA